MLDTFKDVLTKDIELDSVKEILTKDIPLSAVKEVLTKDIELGNLLEMEGEIKALKNLLATEIKLKEFLVQEIDIKKMFSRQTNDADEKELSKENVDTRDKQKQVIKESMKLPPYDGVLIDTLRKEQIGVVFIYKELMRYAKDRNYAQVEKRLAQFSTIMKEHYAYADKELYSYLKSYIKIKYPRRARAFNELSLEMKNISIEAFFSITQSPNIPLSDDTYDRFIAEFLLIGDQINNRIKREEAVLFKMYEESNAAREIS